MACRNSDTLIFAHSTALPSHVRRYLHQFINQLQLPLDTTIMSFLMHQWMMVMSVQCRGRLQVLAPVLIVL